MNTRIGSLLLAFVASLWMTSALSSSQTFRQVDFQLLPSAPAGVLRFAVIGDWGYQNSDGSSYASTQAVADMVHAWSPELILTVGDNTYCSAANWAGCVTRYYSGFISSDVSANRFFPALGNHDWDATLAGWNATFPALPNNKRYYKFAQEMVEFVVLDSDLREPDGTTLSSTQGQWFQHFAEQRNSVWRIVAFHHPAYSSSLHGSSAWMQWNFEQFAVDAVFMGHDHTYERVMHGGIPYFVNGWGGRSLYNFGLPVAGSVVRYNETYGALLVEADRCQMKIQAINISGQTIDDVTLSRHCVFIPATLRDFLTSWGN